METRFDYLAYANETRDDLFLIVKPKHLLLWELKLSLKDRQKAKKIVY